jgi:hypothetical protein
MTNREAIETSSHNTMKAKSRLKSPIRTGLTNRLMARSGGSVAVYTASATTSSAPRGRQSRDSSGAKLSTARTVNTTRYAEHTQDKKIAINVYDWL